MVTALCHLLLLFFDVLFILRETTSRVGLTERGRERIPSRLRAVSVDPDTGPEPTNGEIMT